MNSIAAKLLLLLSPIAISREEISITSKHEMVSKNIVLSFEIKCSEGETSIYPFKSRSVGLSPSDNCTIILYDIEMREINYSRFECHLNSGYAEPIQQIKLHPGSTVKFACEADTTALLYAHSYNLPSRRVLVKTIRFYKMFYHRPPVKLRKGIKAIEELESPLFSL